VLGASGHGKVVADAAECAGWDIVEFFDDAWPERKENGPWLVVGNSADLFRRMVEYDGVIVAIGRNSTRHEKLKSLAAAGAPLVTLVHPAATVSRLVKLGAGSAVLAGAVVNAEARIGSGAILNTGCSVDHDCELGDSVHISPGAHLAGCVKVGDLSWIGIGAAVRQMIRIGSNSVIGAGAAVVADVPSNVVVVGVPARVLPS
jgi:sugar O-acyltransferase (sialic acid O-acetyltransferase NeuD family)